MVREMPTFRPLQTFDWSNMIIPRMDDPFQGAAIRERIVKAVALALLLCVVGAISYPKFGMVVTSGRTVKAEVVRFSTDPAARVAGGDLPVLTVRMPGGSVRDVPADVNNCAPGRWISLVEHGTAVQVGRPGCVTKH